MTRRRNPPVVETSGPTYDTEEKLYIINTYIVAVCFATHTHIHKYTYEAREIRVNVATTEAANKFAIYSIAKITCSSTAQIDKTNSKNNAYKTAQTRVA